VMTTFDLAQDEITSFQVLQQERANVFGRKEDHQSFRNALERLSDEGDEGRRKGLGYWMVGEFENAAARLERYESDVVASFTRANALMSLGRMREAVPIFERLVREYPDFSAPRGGWLDARLEADLQDGDEEQALATLEAGLAEAPPAFAASAESLYLRGRVAELQRNWDLAVEQYEEAREVDPTHRGNLFRLAYLAERWGLEELGLECYQSLASMLPIDSNVLLNLGVLYEDLGRDQDAATCFDTVTKTAPMNRRARLYLEDAKAGMCMYYDEDMEKKEDRLNQILRIPITDFELSVRARNCLNKMDIMTLGDLVKKTEPELLSYKNFGETSLTEIKEILQSKNLRLGMAREEAVASIAKQAQPPTSTGTETTEVTAKSISELKLSIRARRTVENLGCLTIGDIAQHSEEELLGMPNFGVTSLLELKKKLVDFGLKLKGD